jgi:hypothetical protein
MIRFADGMQVKRTMRVPAVGRDYPFAHHPFADLKIEDKG